MRVRDAGIRALVCGPMTVLAVYVQLIGVQFVTETNGLSHSDTRVRSAVGRTILHEQKIQHNHGNQNAYYHAEPGECVYSGSKNLRHISNLSYALRDVVNMALRYLG